MSLRKQLATHGFESNDDYDFALRCLFEPELVHLRVLHVDGASGRRKTAFASALAHALDYPHRLYHDFSQEVSSPPPQPMLFEDGSLGASEPGATPFDRAVTEACAFSEATRTILVLDQLHSTDFADHIRLYQFVASGEWNGAAGQVRANPCHLLLVLISEQPLYHSLAKISYRLWVDAQRAYLDYRPEDYGLGRDAQELFNAMAAVFEAAAAAPTPSEFERLLQDLLLRVRSEDQLRQVIFGRIEDIDRARLYAAALTPLLGVAIDALARYLGHDHVEL